VYSQRGPQVDRALCNPTHDEETVMDGAPRFWKVER